MTVFLGVSFTHLILLLYCNVRNKQYYIIIIITTSNAYEHLRMSGDHFAIIAKLMAN